MIRRRVKCLLLTYVLFGICLFTFSSCEEAIDDLDIIEIRKETDDDEPRVEKPSSNDIDGN